MGEMTQDGRLLSISTPLGKDFVMLKSLSATEAMSQLYKIQVELVHEEDVDGFNPTIVDVNQLIGQPVTITANQKDGGKRIFSGIINQLVQGNRNTRFSYYFATIVPAVWVLTQNIQSRIFQHKSVPDILKDIFSGFDVSYQITGTFKPRNYCVQYRESDFDFVSRLMEEEGIYYYFQHSDGKHKLIIANTSTSHMDCPEKNDIPFLEVPGEDRWTSVIKSWQTQHRLQTGKVTFWDRNFQVPTQNLEAVQPSRYSIGGNQTLELYDYPGGYARKYDGIDKSGGENASDLQNLYTDNKNTVGLRMEAIDALYKTANGVSDCATLTAGHRFKISTHPNKDFNGQYIVTSIQHEAEQTPNYTSNNDESRPYETNFTCIPYGGGAPTFRPILKTPKPIIQGSQTAIVVGPAGEEIFTDKYGRVKVQFYWDRQGSVNADSSCWVRVAQSWAGNKWGTMFIPRIGMEVIVHFLEGDPDQPIITGCVYNPETMPPYTLPDEKTKSTMKSSSSKGGGGFNEFRFEDKKGSEQIFMHGEKDLDIRIKNDAKELIKHDRHLIIENDQYEKVKKDKHLHVNGNQNEQIDAAFSLKVGTNSDNKVGQKFAVDAGMEVHLKAGMSMTMESGTALTLKVGGNFINISPAGISIKGTLVNINSAGAAGSGSGASPEAPKDPKEADNAQPGTTPKAPSAAAPKTPAKYSQKSQAIKNAATRGTPFVSMASSASANAAKKLADAASSSAKKVDEAVNKAKEQVAKAKEAVEEQKKAIEAKKQELAKVVSEKAALLATAMNSIKEKAIQAKGNLDKAVADVKAKEQQLQKEIAEKKQQVEAKVKEAQDAANKQVNKAKEAIAEQEKAIEAKKQELEKTVKEKEALAHGIANQASGMADQAKEKAAKAMDDVKAKEQQVSKEIDEKKQAVEEQKKKVEEQKKNVDAKVQEMQNSIKGLAH